MAAATVGTPCEEVDAVARRIIADAGFGDRFIHRTGHGIGVEEHEDPYVVAGNATPLVPGHAFSVEPGIYTAGRVGHAPRGHRGRRRRRPRPAQPGRPRPGGGRAADRRRRATWRPGGAATTGTVLARMARSVASDQLST